MKINQADLKTLDRLGLDYRQKALLYYGERCTKCGSQPDRIEVHHIDGDRSNDSIDNLEPLCSPCHDKERTTTNGGSVTAPIGEETRDRLRRYKAQDGLSYDEAIEELLDEVGWE